ncbi:MAG: calcium/sodium antiporter [Pseudomonadales bacterium]|nr:calcium/sodium antiporter [Pseudomonadales bacterium]
MTRAQLTTNEGMLLYSAALLLGFLVLFKSADYFVIGSVATATNLKISPMIIGLTVVALGTSAPEIFVSAAASLRGESELAVGNAIGSNIANIGMVLGITAVLVPLPFRPEILKRDMPILIFVTLCAGAALIDYKLGMWDGLLLLAGLVVFLWRIAAEHYGNKDDPVIEELAEIEEVPPMTTPRSLVMLLLSLLFLLMSAELLVWAVTEIAKTMGVSELVIGLTVVAVGTSLPELVVSVTSALKNQTDLAIGNIIGSNIFNILAVLAIPCMLSPTQFTPELLWRDYGTMLGMTLLLVAYAFSFLGRGKITRIEGATLILAWAAYLFMLYRTSVHH